MKPVRLLLSLLVAGWPAVAPCAAPPLYRIVPDTTLPQSATSIQARTIPGALLIAGDGPLFELEFADVADATGTGFDDPLYGAARRGVARAVFEHLSRILAQEPGSARIRLDSRSPWLNDQTLAIGLPYFPCSDGFRRPIIHDALRKDIHVHDIEGELLVNFDLPLSSGLDTPPKGVYDLYTILFHEAVHVLGFVGFNVEADGLPPDCGGARMLPAMAAWVRSEAGEALWREQQGRIVYTGRSGDLPTANRPVLLDGALAEPLRLRLSGGPLRVSGHWLPEDFTGRTGVLMLREPFPSGETRRNLTPESKAVLAEALDYRVGRDLRGLTGSWVDPLIDGQGFSIQFIDRQTLVVYFFGFQDNGERLWTIGVHSGSFSLGEELTIPMFVAEGGRFTGPAGSVSEQPWGELQIRFRDCHSAEARLTGLDGDQQLDLVPLARVEGIDCY